MLGIYKQTWYFGAYMNMKESIPGQGYLSTTSYLIDFTSYLHKVAENI